MRETAAETIAHVRERPGMYFGSAGSFGLLNFVLEVLSNSFDQVLGRRASKIDVTLGVDGSITIDDDGPGMGIGAEGIEPFFTTFRDVPTADGHWPHVHLSVGTGLGPVSAVASSLDVEVRRPDGVYRQSFSRGEKLSELVRAAPDSGRGPGTTIRLVPDVEVFQDPCPDAAQLAEHLRELAFLEPGLVATLTVGGAEPAVFGPVSNLTDLYVHTFGNHRFASEPDPPMILSTTGEDFAVDLALAWSTHRWDIEVRSYGNYRHTAEDGRHVDGIEEGLREVFGPGPVRDPLRGLMAGLQAVLHVKLMDPQFPGPTKRRLSSPEATWCVADLIADQLPAHLERHPSLRTSLEVRSVARKDRPQWEEGGLDPTLA